MPDIFVADAKKDNEVDGKTLDDARLTSSGVNKKPQSDKVIPTGHNRVHLFSSLCKDPDDIIFEDQEENEVILLFIRRAFITNLKWIVIGIFLALLPFIFVGIRLVILPARFDALLLLFYYLLVSSYFYVNFITWYFNISLITNIRVVDIDFSGLVYKNVASTKLSLVQDVSFSQTGVMRTFFDYGDVLVQTAGTLDNFDFGSAPQPENVVHLIGGLIGRNNEQLN
jgi:hypothetical protein